ncbi:MAG: hypothetical protein II403_01800 [Prevotella sp.]|nr:hypothetical protein [Prevotella sp.]
MNISLKKAALAGLGGTAVLLVIHILSFVTFFFRMVFESYFPVNFLTICSFLGTGIEILGLAAIAFFLFTYWKSAPEE